MPRATANGIELEWDDFGAAIPDARLLMVAGMGHDLPEAVWKTVADAIVELAASARERV